MIQWGPFVSDLEALAEKGFKIPALDTRPELDPSLFPVWEAWHTLNRHRSAGMTSNPISVSDIVAYFDLLGISDSEIRVEWFRLISGMEEEYLAAVREAMTTDKGSDHGGASGTHHRRDESRSGGGALQSRRRVNRASGSPRG